ncbi:L-ribulose-5-phosphate 3-epimerase [Ornithinimicrobium cavernae]|uniref:L-ribulose-5-phosphate 3-epimerase n=1 Tax=Ornithinimicrobium cavernae TaxID=2666047 RepID=UPI000D6918C5|nr:L-ribulose-5-phosphate 3-epimerase [Ornithinimicrobium cavernae]
MSAEPEPQGPPIGIYEKALAPGTWLEMLTAAGRAGYSFVEISVDETEGRLRRLEWDSAQRDELRNAVRQTGVRVPTLCLSAHRRFGLGSGDPETLATARRIAAQAVELADAVGVRVIQVAGYFAYYEQADPGARGRFVAEMSRFAQLAGRYGVMLALENIDTADVGSVRDACQIADEVDSQWFGIYPDVGNIVVNGHDVASDLRAIGSRAVGIHLKDARLGEPRRVPFGTGSVPFPLVFSTLQELAYRGPFMIEMWNDDPATAEATAADALTWIRAQMAEAA